MILDGEVYVLDKQKGFESKELTEQAKYEEDQLMKKTLLEAAGYLVIDSPSKVF